MTAVNYIAGSKTADDWKATRAILVGTQDPAVWRDAFDTFFRTRLELRYLHPIQRLQEHGTFSGEGFSIAAIQCSLIEFLESTVQGINYRHTWDPSTLGPYEYSSSSRIFQNFLTAREPFSRHFSQVLAQDFYTSVRCGLLHEARTKGGWRIHARDEQKRLIDPVSKIVFRDDFHAGLLEFVDAYGSELANSIELQLAFIRKFDALCD
jgi:hypothetical protein